MAGRLQTIDSIDQWQWWQATATKLQTMLFDDTWITFHLLEPTQEFQKIWINQDLCQSKQNRNSRNICVHAVACHLEHRLSSGWTLQQRKGFFINGVRRRCTSFKGMPGCKWTALLAIRPVSTNWKTLNHESLIRCQPAAMHSGKPKTCWRYQSRHDLKGREGKSLYHVLHCYCLFCVMPLR